MLFTQVCLSSCKSPEFETMYEKRVAGGQCLSKIVGKSTKNKNTSLMAELV